MENSLNYVLKRLLNENRIKLDEKELQFQLLSHPSYPSLHSLTGVLNHFNVSNLALHVPQDNETILQLPSSFIAHIKKEHGEYFALVICKEEKFNLIYDKREKEIVLKEEFIEMWTGNIIVVEDNGESPEIQTDKTVFKRMIFSLGFLAVLFVFFFNQPTIFESVHFLLSIIGLGFSIVIVKHELGLSSIIADKFCSGNIEKINCNDVLKSKAANFIGGFKLSDVGIIYFLALSLSWILLSFNAVSYDLIIIISALAIPFTFYSIAYQYFVVKKWCLLCLSIVFTLWLQAGLLFFIDFEISNITFSLNSLVLISFSFILVLSLWQFVLPKLKNEQELNKLKIEHYKFKRDFNLFDALISKSPKVDTEIDSSLEIILGNKSKDASLKITVITNPLCGHCRAVHEILEKLLEANNKDIQVCIRFLVDAKDERRIETQIAQRLIELYHKEKMEVAIEALHEIYSGITPLEWLKKWQNSDDRNCLIILEKEQKWCLENSINFTPEILVNGQSFPKEYERSDLLYFIDEIIETELQKAENVIPELEFTT